jgi:hypothetical protein
LSIGFTQRVSLRGGVIVQAINRYVRMRCASFDSTGVSRDFVRYL